MSLKDEIISNLKNQEWSFDTLFPDFDESLKLKSDKSFITSRCAEYYLNSEIDVLINEPATYYPYLITANDSCGFWDYVLEKISSDTIKFRLADFNPEHIESILESLIKIKKNDPIVYSYFKKYIPFILVVEKNEAYSLSTPHLFGTIILSENLFSSTEDVDITLVHELAHQELFLINLIDSLINERFLSSLKYSPFQRKERPPLGRLHASHALFRMSQYSLKSNNCNHNSIKQEFAKMIATLQEFELTRLGNTILESYITFYNRVGCPAGD